jgi:hypothetical protein
MRGVRYQLNELIAGLAVQDLAPMSLGLSHSLSRFKLKFSSDKVYIVVAACCLSRYCCTYVNVWLLIYIKLRHHNIITKIV